MRRFAAMYEALDASTSTNDKVAALVSYFRDAPVADAAWAAWMLTGGRIKRSVTRTELRAGLARATGHQAWLIDACYEAVGDTSEMISLLLPDAPAAASPALHEVFERVIVPMARMRSEDRVALLLSQWRGQGRLERFVFHKLLGGALRVGVSRTLAARALAQAYNVDAAVMAHRLMGDWKPTPLAFEKLISGESDDAGARPYPFMLASPLEEEVATLGAIENWQLEWKWDGFRAQVIVREGMTAIWSRGEELLTDRFGDLVASFEGLERGCVLDGEILAWDTRQARPLSFSVLQTRIGRTTQARFEELLFIDTPVRFVAYDVLEVDGKDQRGRALRERRDTLERIVRDAPGVGLSEVQRPATWDDARSLRTRARACGVEGLMLKRLDSTYGVGRSRGSWWKWKVDPFTIDAVLVAAQAGSGRRAAVLTDYTFAVWSGSKPGEGELVTIAKAYSGLTDEEIDRVDAIVRGSTIAKHGPVRAVRPTLVFELAFDSLGESSRHKAGLALRFPRISRWRTDKRPEDADTVASVRALLRLSGV